MITTAQVLAQFEKVLANVATEKVAHLAAELAKIVPLPHSPIEWRVGWSNDEKLEIVHCSISFKTQIGATDEKTSIILLGLFLEKADEQLLVKLHQALDLILEYAQTPYHLNFLPSLQTEQGIGIIYFTIEAKVKKEILTPQV